MEDSNIGRRVKIKFFRQDLNKTRRLKKVWRKPKGLHSKLRLNKKGHERTPSQGYRLPRKLRGKVIKLVRNFNDLENVKKILIASTVGLKKKVEIVKVAKEKGIEIINVKEVDKFLSDVESMLSKKRDVKKKRVDKKKKTKAELEKKESTADSGKTEEEEKKNVSKKLTENVEQKQAQPKPVSSAPKSGVVHQATAPKQK